MIRKLLVAAGELLVTAGLLLVLFFVWEFGWVGWTAGAAQDAQAGRLSQEFEARRPETSAPGTIPVLEEKLKHGELFGVIRIPRLGGTWAKPIGEGVGLDVLLHNVGHYEGTALPGQVGNASFAGHRSGAGNPLIDIDAIQPGDAMVIETKDGWYMYKAQGHEIVRPTQVDVVAPVPDHPGQTPTQRWLTLTSCNPRWGSTDRYIVHALFDRFVPRASGEPAEIKGGR
ncbi:class E sortase [Sinomonas sp. ASV322]|uniref:class E sortase n=1 Tax=Sinomonas sp. ASV322 TaxID=3041920 RepID=UPI0027DABE8F|nr:class E sortase [Sinomonas sp. ASV322]MDQ4503860.1 class E sortase [Sinomonas sp. ASV322]